MKTNTRYCANVRAALVELWGMVPSAIFVLIVALISAGAFGD